MAHKIPYEIEIEGHSGLVRDTKSHAVINTNRTALIRARLLKKARGNMDARLTNLEDEIKNLKSLLIEAINGNNRN